MYAMSEKRYIPRSRSEFLVSLVFRKGYTWNDLEKFFCIKRKELKEELSGFITGENSKERIYLFNEQMEKNERRGNRLGRITSKL